MVALFGALSVLALAVGETDAQVAFSTTGGDAWSFNKRIEVLSPDDACEEIVVSSAQDVARTRSYGGRTTLLMPLKSGANELRAECLKAGRRLGDIARQHWFVRLRDAPKARIAVTVSENGVLLGGDASEPASGNAAPIVSYQWTARASNPLPLQLPEFGGVVHVPTPSADGTYYIALHVTDAAGRTDESTVALRVRGGNIQRPDVLTDRPEWLDAAVVYGVMPKAFGSGQFREITARLKAFADLGVDVLWLSPITASPTQDFGYAVTDHFRIRDGLGDASDLHALIRGAHARGMRVILDFVPNHFSDQHSYYKDVEQRHSQSAYYDFFARAAGGQATNYFDWHNLKNLNYDNPEVRRLIIEAFAYWVREFDVDGFRVDVAWGPRQRAPDFWPSWRRELKRIKPDLLLLAEGSARDPFYVRNGFDAAYDWTSTPGKWAWEGAFNDETNTAARLRAEIAASQADPETLVFRFLNNNDTGPRFISRYGLERTRVATIMLFSLPGLPSIYTGDEVGAAFEPYKTTSFDWADRHDLRAWHARLLALRRHKPALRSRAISLLDASHSDGVLVFERPGPNPEQSVLVLLNFSRTRTLVDLTPGGSGLLANVKGNNDTVHLHDLLSGEDVAVSRQRPRFELGPYGARMLGAAKESS